MPPASWTGSPTGASGPSAAACRWRRWSTAGRPSSCWPGRPTTPPGRPHRRRDRAAAECRDGPVTLEYGDDRGRSEQPGIVSKHCFSAGPYYDPERIALGPIVGVDEHLVEP